VTVGDEIVYPVGQEVQIMKHLVVEHDCSTKESEAAAKFNEAVKPIIEGISDAKINVSAKIVAGEMY